MEIVKRLPLTTSAFALVIAYSALKVGIGLIKRIFTPNYIQNIASILPWEIQEEIIQHLFDPENANDSGLLHLSLTCKRWNKFISENQAWLNVRLPYQVRKIELQDLDREVTLVPREVDLLGTDQVFSPKLAYFFLAKRDYPGNGRFWIYTRFSSDLYRYKDDQLYVPWINHNLLQRPRTLWQFIKTLLIAPEWLSPLLVISDRKHGRKDEKTRRRMYPIIVFCSILLSFLPYLDIVLFRPDALISQITRVMASENKLHYLLWEMKPWSAATFFRASLNLMPLQFFENSMTLDGGVLFLARLVLIALSSLLSIGPLVHQLVMAGSGLLCYLLVPLIRSKDIKFLICACYFLPWLCYLGPLQALLFLAFLLGFFLDMWLTQMRKSPEKGFKVTPARNRFLLHLLALLSNLL